MDKEFFLNAGIPPPGQFDQLSWQALSSAMELHADQSSDCFFADPSLNFESELSSMVSSPAAASNSGMSNENFMIRELIGKLGNICSSGEISPATMAGGGFYAGCSASTNNSCYSTPLSSPPKISMPIMDHFAKENYGSLGNSTSNLPAMPVDPGFAERAARFSSFGSRSFNGRMSPFGLNKGAELPYRSSTPLTGSGKLSRVSSSPSLKTAESQIGNQETEIRHPHVDGRLSRLAGNSTSDHENSSLSEQNQGGNDLNSRKRKAVPKGEPKGKPKEPANHLKVGDNGNNNSSAKRSRSDEGNGDVKDNEDNAETEKEDDCKKQSNNANQKPPEAPKDYIHVRARRGQATDSHSLAERVRREKISERMKLLQDLVPGCNKVTGKALVLDEIINYVQSLQRQVEFLSMKLATVNPRLEFNPENIFSKDPLQPSCSLPQPGFPLDSIAATIYGGHQNHQPSSQNNITSTPVSHRSMDSLQGLQLPSIEGFTNGTVPKLPALCEDDLQTIVQMGFAQNESLHGPNQTPLMKIEF